MKLKKIILHDGNEVLQQNEMKMIKGGDGETKSCNSSSCTGSCRELVPIWNIYKDGVCQWNSIYDSEKNEYLVCECKLKL